MKTLEQIRAELKSYAIEVEFPDIGRWQQGNTGVDYVHTFDSGVAGPHVMIMALTHGNEVSGAIAVDTLLRARLRPRHGRVTLAFANFEAYGRFDASKPDTSRFVDEDLNRVWSASRLDGTDDSWELRRARALRPIIDKVDFLLDLHSMSESSPPLMLSGPLDKGIRFALEVGVPEHVIVDAGHKNGTRMRDYGGFGDPASPKNALLIETGQHFERAAQNVALDAACRFLIKTNGTAPGSDFRDYLLPLPAKQQVLEVTHAIAAESMDVEFLRELRGLDVIDRAGTAIARDGKHQITTPYNNCVIIMPGLRQLRPGVTVMRLARLRNKGLSRRGKK
jgi:succinylglutamate desuccinylase/aspartoacylase family protein